MSKGRVPSSKRKARGTSQGKVEPRFPSTPRHRFLGVSLSGGKSDKACIAVLEYYPEQNKIFLVRLIEKVKAEEFISADLKIHEVLLQYAPKTEAVAFDVPLSLPKCLRCELRCPGYEACNEPEITYIRDLYQIHTDKKKPKKMYTPYTQRCVESYLSLIEEGQFDVQHALGANMAPMTARAHFIKRRLSLKVLEVFTKLCVWRLGQQLKVNKSQLRIYRNSVGGAESRRVFLQAMVDKWGVFIYQQDCKILVDNFHAFEAFISAYMALLNFQGKTEKRPPDFPAKEQWVEIPHK